MLRIYAEYEDHVNYYIIMEYIRGGNLYENMIESKFLSEKHVANYIKQLLLVCNFLHLQGIVHRDVKLENIMVKRYSKDVSEMSLVLIDFGFATECKEGNKLTQ